MTRTTLMLLSVFTFATAAAADNPRDRWLDSFEDAVVAARKENKPIFLVFRCER